MTNKAKKNDGTDEFKLAAEKRQASRDKNPKY